MQHNHFPARSMGDVMRSFVLANIANVDDPAERKARIMIARADGHLSDSETEAWIRADGLEGA